MDAKTLQRLRATWNEYLAKRENASAIWCMNQVGFGFLDENTGGCTRRSGAATNTDYTTPSCFAETGTLSAVSFIYTLGSE